MIDAIGNMIMAIMIIAGGIIFIVANINYKPDHKKDKKD